MRSLTHKFCFFYSNPDDFGGESEDDGWKEEIEKAEQTLAEIENLKVEPFKKPLNGEPNEVSLGIFHLVNKLGLYLEDIAEAIENDPVDYELTEDFKVASRVCVFLANMEGMTDIQQVFIRKLFDIAKGYTRRQVRNCLLEYLGDNGQIREDVEDDEFGNVYAQYVVDDFCDTQLLAENL